MYVDIFNYSIYIFLIKISMYNFLNSILFYITFKQETPSIKIVPNAKKNNEDLEDLF